MMPPPIIFFVPQVTDLLLVGEKMFRTLKKSRDYPKILKRNKPTKLFEVIICGYFKYRGVTGSRLVSFLLLSLWIVIVTEIMTNFDCLLHGSLQAGVFSQELAQEVKFCAVAVLAAVSTKVRNSWKNNICQPLLVLVDLTILKINISGHLKFEVWQ